jgi:hypothetical protein
MKAKPSDWDWCPNGLWRAYLQGEYYQGIPAEHLEWVINAPFREFLCPRLEDRHAPRLIDKLMKVELEPGISRSEVLRKVLYAACVSPEIFPSDRDTAAEQAAGEKVANLARDLVRELQRQSTLEALTHRYDDHVDFSRTGRFLDAPKLQNQLLPLLDQLANIAELPTSSGEDETIVPKNISTRPYIIKERLLKRELVELTGKPRVSLVAELINWLHPEANRGYHSVRKS